MKTILVFCFACCFCFPGYASANGLLEVKEKTLVHLLNDFETVAEIRELPYKVRVIRLRDRGECDGNPRSCPQEVFYISVTTWDEKPIQKVYVLPKSYGWVFIDWKYLPKEEGKDYLIIFEVAKKVISKDIEKEWWAEEKYEVRVNPWKGDYRKLNP